MRVKLWKTLAFFGIVAVVAGRIGVAEAGVVYGEAYTEQRAQLLAEGWKPNTSYGLKLSNGKPLHRFPEVLCGMEMCKAKWRDPRGGEQTIILKRGGPTEEYRVVQ
jgi:hypothetical protein